MGTRKILVGVDGGAESPREWGNLGDMRCWHNHYDLGDAPLEFRKPEDWGLEVMAELGGMSLDEAEYRFESDLCGRFGDLLGWIEGHRDYIGFRVYLYDHSGLSMSVNGGVYPFNDRWDAGCVGVIYTTRRRVLERYGRQRMSSKLRARVESELVSEVEAYDAYLRGEVFYVMVVGEGGEETDSCGGIYGQRALGSFLADDSFKDCETVYLEEGA